MPKREYALSIEKAKRQCRNCDYWYPFSEKDDIGRCGMADGPYEAMTEGSDGCKQWAELRLVIEGAIECRE